MLISTVLFIAGRFVAISAQALGRLRPLSSIGVAWAAAKMSKRNRRSLGTSKADMLGPTDIVSRVQVHDGRRAGSCDVGAGDE